MDFVKSDGREGLLHLRNEASVNACKEIKKVLEDKYFPFVLGDNMNGCYNCQINDMIVEAKEEDRMDIIEQNCDNLSIISSEVMRK